MIRDMKWRIISVLLALIVICIAGLGTDLSSFLKDNYKWIIGGILVASVLAIILVLWISSKPSGKGMGKMVANKDAGFKDRVALITRERDRMASIFSHMGDGFFIVDGNSRVTQVNQAAQRILRLSENKVLGRTFIEAVRDYELDDILQRCLKTKKEQSGTVETSPRGQFLGVIATPLEEEGGCLLLVQDLTRIRQLETVRRDFVANISHELRTPTASIKALAETLQDGAIDDPCVAKEFLAKIDIEVDKLTQMVQELGDLSGIESGESHIHKSPFDLAEAVEQAAGRLRMQADRAGIDLSVDMDSILAQAIGDRDRIEQVLVNLIHNAIKFTPPGGRVKILTRAEGHNILISVADTGIGISSEDLPRIFERFYKADKSRSGGGTGIGLAIAKHIVEAHGGRIWAESAESKGSTFSFSLPLDNPLKQEKV